MCVNNERSQTHRPIPLDSRHISYALLGCLSSTSRNETLVEMLSYVLVCSAKVAEKLDSIDRLPDIIDEIVEVVGSDYKESGAYIPAQIFAGLDRRTRQVLFGSMTASDPDKESQELVTAKKKLNKLLTGSDTSRLTSAQHADIFLPALVRYLHIKLIEITSIMTDRLYGEFPAAADGTKST